MPAYEFSCRMCNEITEAFYKIDEAPFTVACELCGQEAVRIISNVNTFNEFPSWLNDSVRSQLQDESEKPIESRSELNRYLRDNGIVENPKN